MAYVGTDIQLVRRLASIKGSVWNDFVELHILYHIDKAFLVGVERLGNCGVMGRAATSFGKVLS